MTGALKIEASTVDAPKVAGARMRPKDAATIILIDRTGAEPKVLLGRRHTRHVFMPGALVFPGGRVDATDHRVPVASALIPATERRLLATTGSKGAARAHALAVAAIRELYEETGLCIGTFSGAPPQRHDLSIAFAKCGLLPDLARLRLFARAITPPGRVRRFDTRFFMAEAAAITHRLDEVVGGESELTELVWLPIAQARDAEVPKVTRMVLGDLESQIAAGFIETRIPFYHFQRGSWRRDLI